MRKVLYFVPAIFGLVFYSLLAVFSGFGAIHLAVWLCIVMLFVSGVLLGKKKWFGCIPGVLVGVILIWMNTPGWNRQFDRASPTPIPLKSYTLSTAPTPPV